MKYTEKTRRPERTVNVAVADGRPQYDRIARTWFDEMLRRLCGLRMTRMHLTEQSQLSGEDCNQVLRKEQLKIN